MAHTGLNGRWVVCNFLKSMHLEHGLPEPFTTYINLVIKNFCERKLYLKRNWKPVSNLFSILFDFLFFLHDYVLEEW